MDVRNRIYRSRRHRMIAGVCGGLADYFGLTPTGVRLIYFLVSVLSAAFPGILVYIVLWIVLPMEPLPGERIDAEEAMRYR